MTIGEAIRAYRKDNDLSQIALAEQWEVGQQTISYWETGKTFPDDLHCTVIAKALGMSLAKLLEIRHAGATDPGRDYSKGMMSKDELIADQEKEIARLKRRLRKLEG